MIASGNTVQQSQMVSFGTQLWLQALLYNNSIILWARIWRQPDFFFFFFIAQRSIYIILSIILRTANNGENGTKDRIIQHWRRNERQMVMEQSGPNKTHWFVMQNAAFKRLLKAFFFFFQRGNLDPKQLTWGWQMQRFAPLRNLCISYQLTLIIKSVWLETCFDLRLSNALIKSRATPDTNTASIPLFPLTPVHMAGNNVFGRRAYECWLKGKFK